MSTDWPVKIGSLVIPPSEQTPLVLALLEIIRQQDEEIKSQRDRLFRRRLMNHFCDAPQPAPHPPLRAHITQWVIEQLAS